MTDEPINVPIGDELDLHTFNPRELGDLVPEYIRACREQGLTRVRIIHGKGTGQLRDSVHAILRGSPEVVSFSLGGAGGWGATVAVLTPVD